MAPEMPGNFDPDPQNEVTLLQAIASRLGIDARYIDGQTEVVLLRLILAGISAIYATGGLPDQTGQAGKFLTTNGTGALWAALAGGGDMLKAIYDPAGINAQLAGAEGEAIDAAAFRTALALGTAAQEAANAFATAAQGAKADTALQPSDVGTAAAQDVGVNPGNVVQLDGASKLPAVDGSQLTNLPGGTGAVQVPQWSYGTVSTPPAGNGEFSTNNTTVSNVTVVSLRKQTTAGSFHPMFAELFDKPGTILLATRTTAGFGSSFAWQVTAIADFAEYVELTVTFLSGNGVTLSNGDTFSFLFLTPIQAWLISGDVMTLGDGSVATTQTPDDNSTKAATTAYADAAAAARASAAQGAKADSAIQPGDGGLVPVDTGWTANASAGDKTVAVADYAGGGALAGLDATADQQIIDLTKKLQALEAGFASALRPNA